MLYLCSEAFSEKILRLNWFLLPAELVLSFVDQTSHHKGWSGNKLTARTHTHTHTHAHTHTHTHAYIHTDSSITVTPVAHARPGLTPEYSDITDSKGILLIMITKTTFLQHKKEHVHKLTKAYTYMSRTISKPLDLFKAVQTAFKLSEQENAISLLLGWLALRLCGPSPAPHSTCDAHGYAQVCYSKDVQS